MSGEDGAAAPLRARQGAGPDFVTPAVAPVLDAAPERLPVPGRFGLPARLRSRGTSLD